MVMESCRGSSIPLRAHCTLGGEAVGWGAGPGTATVYKMLEELLPENTRLSTECRELFVECCTEFINLLSSESLEASEKDKKKIIGPEHVIKAVEVSSREGSTACTRGRSVLA